MPRKMALSGAEETLGLHAPAAEEASKGRALFHDIVLRTGLAAIIGPGTVQRALVAIGISSPEQARIVDYLRALPELRARMAIYLDMETCDHRVRQIEVHLKHIS